MIKLLENEIPAIRSLAKTWLRVRYGIDGLSITEMRRNSFTTHKWNRLQAELEAIRFAYMELKCENSCTGSAT